MLYLIGGAPRCGKSTVARQLAGELCCSRVPADYLGTAFASYIPDTDDPEDWVLRSTTNPVTFSRVAAMVCEYSDIFLSEARTYGFTTLMMDQPFQQRSSEVVAYIQQMVRGQP